jgi:ABC-2 type transport system ATP-binding protein
MDVLKIEGLHKSFGSGSRIVHANAGIDLAVSPGEVVGLLGHNGAGKSTLVNQVVGLLRPDSGTISLAGVDAVAHPEQARRLTSIQPQGNVPITGLSPRVAIELVGQIRGGDRAVVRSRADALIEALELGPWANTPSEKLSGGIARLTAFAMTAVSPGQLIVLDEPTNDVDPVRRRLLWDQIRALADSDAAVLLVTHNVREAEHVVDRLAILNYGVVLAAGTPAELTSTLADTLSLEVEVERDTVPTWPGGIAAEQRGPTHWLATVPAPRAGELITWATQERQSGGVERYALTPQSLEDVYIHLVNNEETAA